MRIIWMSMIICLFFGCSDFLDEVDKDKLIPTETDHYASVLLNCIRYDYPVFGAVDFMADNLTEYRNAMESSRKKRKPIYTWQIEIEIDEEGNEVGGNKLWEVAYKDIAIANYVLELVDDAIGTGEEKDFIKGEAYFLRAMCYFNLLNIYGAPFNPESAVRDLGVPLRLNNGIEQTYQRNTVAECYRQIEKDIDEASRLIQKSGIEKSKYHPSVGACALLLSRVYLYQEKWEDVVSAATEAMKYGSLSRIPTNGVFLTPENAELLYSGMLYNGTLYHTHFDGEGWQVAPELLALYDSEDLRFNCFFTKAQGKMGNVYYSNKGMDSYSSMGECNMRLAEAYLNRAEAYARLNQPAEAVRDMTDLLSKRYSRSSGFDIPEETEELLDFIQKERRKELCYEEHHRWFDLRRMRENAPEVVHAFTITDESGIIYGTQYYTLFPGELNYTLPLPLKERDNNPLIQNNERYDKLPETNDEIVIP